MTFEVQVPTKEYAYIKAHVEGTVEDAAKVHQELEALSLTPLLETLKDKDFNKMVDDQMLERPLDADTYAELNIVQRAFIQTIKRSFKRIKNAD